MFDSKGNSSPIIDWTTLPPELFEIIITYLDLDEVKALRLTARKFAEKCIGPRFLGSIEQPTLDVSLHNLRSLYALACNPPLSNKIYSLTLLATSLDSSELEKNVKSGKYTVHTARGPFFEAVTTPYTPEELSSAKSDLDWFEEQRKARANESSEEMLELLQLLLKGFGKLDSIHLDGAFIRGREQRVSTSQGKWYPLWMRASSIFSLVVTALAQSGVSVKKFNAYRQTPRCCIPSGHITTYASDLDSEQLGIVVKSLESLELSMSVEVQSALNSTDTVENSKRDEDTESEYEDETEDHLICDDPGEVLDVGTPGITSLLRPALALRELDLFFRNTLERGKLDSYNRLIESMAHETQFPLLEKCAFSGFPAKGDSILLFLQKHPGLRSFTLHECTLTTGSWTPIFSYMNQSMPGLEKVSFSNLYEKFIQDPKLEEREEDGSPHQIYGMVNLHPIWDTDRPRLWDSFTTTQGREVHTRNFNHEELKKGLMFRPVVKRRGRTKSSPEVMRWVNSRRALYGPP
jgi:hypothetical protein